MKGTDAVGTKLYDAKEIYVCKHKVAKPVVFIPVFPGTNCEYDSTVAFERAGADVVTKVFRNLSAEDIRDSVDEFEKAITQAQIIMFREDSRPVTSLTEARSSSRQRSRTRRLRRRSTGSSMRGTDWHWASAMDSRR